MRREALCGCHGGEQHHARRFVTGLEALKRRLHGSGCSKSVDAKVPLKVVILQPGDRLQVDGSDRVDQTRKLSIISGCLGAAGERVRGPYVAGCEPGIQFLSEFGETRFVCGDEVKAVSAFAKTTSGRS